MKYYSREILEQYLKNTRLNKILDIIDEIDKEINPNSIINVQFCHDCPMFEPDSVQFVPSITRGWCRRMSYYRIFDDETPHYVYVNDQDFCNKDDIGDEDDY